LIIDELAMLWDGIPLLGVIEELSVPVIITIEEFIISELASVRRLANLQPFLLPKVQ
jgi:hypothetical protein